MRDGDYDEATGRSASRPFSWGPVGEFYYRESLCLSETDRSLFSHHECNGQIMIVVSVVSSVSISALDLRLLYKKCVLLSVCFRCIDVKILLWISRF